MESPGVIECESSSRPRQRETGYPDNVSVSLSVGRHGIVNRGGVDTSAYGIDTSLGLT